MNRMRRLVAALLSALMVLQASPVGLLAEEVFSPPVSLAGFMDETPVEAQSVSHTVIFRDWDGTTLLTVSDVQDGTRTDTIDPDPAPTRTGYTFMGWSPPDEYITGDEPTTYTFTAQYQTSYVYTVTVEYRLNDAAGALMAPEYRGTYAYGDTFEAVSPIVVGYDYDQASVTGWAGEEGLTDTEQNYLVIYTASTGTPYQVVHHFQNIDDDGYDTDTPAITQNLTATTGATIEVYALAEGIRPAGFTPDEEVKTVTIAADGSTAVDMYYTRKGYKLTYDSAGGAFVEPFIARHGAAVPAVDDPMRTGYSFTGWTPAIPATLIDGRNRKLLHHLLAGKRG